MIEWLISFGNGCHYITMAFLLLYLLWLVRESFRTRKSGVVREEIMYSDDAGKCFLALWLAAEYLMRENFPFSLYPHYTAQKYWIAWPLLILCVGIEKGLKHKGLSQLSGDRKIVRERQAGNQVKQEMSFKSLAESVSEMEKFVEQFTRIAAESNQLQAENNQLRGQLQLQRERILELERQRYETQ